MPRPRRRRRAALSRQEIDRESGRALPAREALSVVTPAPGDGALQAMELLPDGSSGEQAIADHAPVYRIQPMPAEEL